MKNLLYLAVLLLMVIIGFEGCKKDEENDSEEIEFQTISGTVTPPTGIANTTDWTVNSGTSESVVIDNGYEVEVAKNQFAIQFVSDASGKDVLMGLSYPGQTDFTINTQSTVLAMLMQMPGIESLTEQGKLNFIANAKTNPAMATAVAELEQQLNAGDDLFDTTNTVLFNKFTLLFESAIQKTEAVQIENVNIIKVGKQVTFQNPGNSFAVAIGIYKNNQLQKTLSLDRYQFFVNSLLDIPNSVNSPADPIEQSYTFPSDGQYEIKVRTGRPFSGVNDALSAEAQRLNMNNIAVDLVWPYLKTLAMGEGCVGKMRLIVEDVVDTYTSTLSQNNGSAQQVVSILIRITATTYEIMETSIECSSNSKVKGFWGKMNKMLGFIGKASEITSQTLNGGRFVYQWFNAPAARNILFSISGNSITEISNEPLTVMEQLIQYGPWKGQEFTSLDTTIFLVISFSGVDCMCFSGSTYYRDLIDPSQYHWYSNGASYCISPGSDDYSYLLNYSNCPALSTDSSSFSLMISNLTPQSVTLGSDHWSVPETFTPFR